MTTHASSWSLRCAFHRIQGHALSQGPVMRMPDTEHAEVDLTLDVFGSQEHRCGGHRQGEREIPGNPWARVHAPKFKLPATSGAPDGA